MKLLQDLVPGCNKVLTEKTLNHSLDRHQAPAPAVTRVRSLLCPGLNSGEIFLVSGGGQGSDAGRNHKLRVVGDGVRQPRRHGLREAARVVLPRRRPALRWPPGPGSGCGLQGTPQTDLVAAETGANRLLSYSSSGPRELWPCAEHLGEEPTMRRAAPPGGRRSVGARPRRGGQGPRGCHRGSALAFRRHL